MQDKLASVITKLKLFSSVPGILSLVEELNKFNAIAEPQEAEIERLRTPLLDLLNFPICDQIRIDNLVLSDAVHETLMVFAERHPKNNKDPINLKSIPDNRRACISTGEVFNIEYLAAYHHKRQPRRTPPFELEIVKFVWDETQESKWLLHPLTNLPFHHKDAAHIRECCIAQQIPLLDLRCSSVVVDRMVKSVRNLPAPLGQHLERLRADHGAQLMAPNNRAHLERLRADHEAQLLAGNNRAIRNEINEYLEALHRLAGRRNHQEFRAQMNNFENFAGFLQFARQQINVSNAITATAASSGVLAIYSRGLAGLYDMSLFYLFAQWLFNDNVTFDGHYVHGPILDARNRDRNSSCFQPFVRSISRFLSSIFNTANPNENNEEPRFRFQPE